VEPIEQVVSVGGGAEVRHRDHDAAPTDLRLGPA
jgi:hypothetical protein